MSLEYYECPSCGTHNEDYITYCKKCGAWLVGGAKKVNPRKKSTLSSIIGAIFIVILIVGVTTYFKSSEQPSKALNEIKFEDMDFGEQYTLTQFNITNPSSKYPSIAADLSVKEDTQHPINIKAVFYDEDKNRVGIATSNVGHKLLANKTTTIIFTVEDGADLKRAANVRIEISTESPLETLKKISK